ncbi:restriction endonuclease [Cryobacterium psychrotolerans]|nr:restriction endonuclease [Cryobacterium psychrotolerans]
MQSESQVPIWPAFIIHTLRALADGATLSRRELTRKAVDNANLSEVALLETLTSGALRCEQRAGWAITHLAKANWIERPSRAQYRITEDGRAWLAAHPEGLADYSTARTTFAPYWPKKYIEAPPMPSPSTKPLVATHEIIEPVEQIEDAIGRINSDVADSLLDRLRVSHPDFFETAVVSVLLKMGYGGAEQRGRRIGGTSDGGVDGVIDQDPLGLDRVYIQAKRYADGNNVGREAIQAFVGALHGVAASKGVFITTSAFTEKARGYASSVSTRIILIDGPRLASLMIKYCVGVQVTQTYEVVEVDEDFFD